MKVKNIFNNIIPIIKNNKQVINKEKDILSIPYNPEFIIYSYFYLELIKVDNVFKFN